VDLTAELVNMITASACTRLTRRPSRRRTRSSRRWSTCGKPQPALTDGPPDLHRMNGAKHTLDRQAVTAHNLANLSTSGYKSQIGAFRALPVVGDGAKTRVSRWTPPSARTFARRDAADRPPAGCGGRRPRLDRGAGPTGARRTRAPATCSSTATPAADRTGLNVLGDAANHGSAEQRRVDRLRRTVSAVPTDNVRIRSTSWGGSSWSIRRAGSGARRRRAVPHQERTPGPGRCNVRLATSALEGSNVSMVDALVDMISQARHYETQLKLLQTAEPTPAVGQVMSMSG